MSYRSTQAADGTWTIHDVEVFACIPPGERGIKNGIDGKWLDRCAVLMQAEYATGYLPPVHLLHHGEAVPPSKVGHLKVTRVGEWLGEPCLFADLVGIAPEFLDSLSRGDWPYRSAEVPIGEEPRLSSLALLSSQPPHFRFPMLVPNSPMADWSAPEGSASTLAAYSRIGNGLVACFKFEGETVTDDAEPKDEAEKVEAKAEDAPAPEAEDKPADAAPEGDSEEAQEEKEVAAPAWAASLAAGVNRLLDLIDPERQKALDAAQDKPAVPPADPAQMSASAEVAKFAGENAALKLAAKRAESDAAEAAVVADAVTKLGSFHLTDAEKTDLRGLAKFGQAAVDAFVRTVKARAITDPPKTLDAALSVAATNEIDPPEVVRFSDRGPEYLDRARQAHGRWKQLQASGFQMPLPKFLELNVK